MRNEATGKEVDIVLDAQQELVIADEPLTLEALLRHAPVQLAIDEAGD